MNDTQERLAKADQDFQHAAKAALMARRAALAGYDKKRFTRKGDAGRPEAVMGLALSGGGIRSATLSIGAIQRLAETDRLFDFDYVSTVSGGGYAGTFLRSLFLPFSARGKKPQIGGPELPVDTLAGFAIKALSGKVSDANTEASHSLLDEAHQSDVSAQPKTEHIRSPVWWLREHSRYLSPNGPTDYSYLIAVMVRSWLAMLYTFALPMAVTFLLLSKYGWELVAAAKGLDLPVQALLFPAKNVVLSPVLCLVIPVLLLAIGCGASYWMTIWIAIRTPFKIEPIAKYFIGTLCTAMIMAFCAYWVNDLIFLAKDATRPTPQFTHWALVFLAAIAALSVLFALAALLSVIWSAIPDLLRSLTAKPEPNSSSNKVGFDDQLKVRLTRWSSNLNTAAFVLLVLAAIDSAALTLLHSHKSNGNELSGWPVLAGPAGAWAIHQISKLVSSGGDQKSSWLTLLTRFLDPALLVLGALLFGLLAIVADYFQLRLLFPGGIESGAVLDSESADFWRFFLILAIMLVVTGFSTEFVNLSSLHNFYRSRLTRAFLGASNVNRLHEFASTEHDRPITDSHPRDDIELEPYQTYPSPAPLHLINVTLNETMDPSHSQLLERDRKGVSMCFGPEGLVIDPIGGQRTGRDRYFNWQILKAANVSALTVGRLCAISGAAATTGMGSRTSLGKALTMTFANIRMGYWWNIGDLQVVKRTQGQRVRAWLAKPFQTYVYLLNEMLGRYARHFRHLYLSDGGHYENSGAYELLRRGVKLIVVMDNGEDAEFRFEDMQNLIHKARIDLGLSINMTPADELDHFLGKSDSRFFLNTHGENWRAAAQERAADDDTVALLLDVRDKRPGNGDNPPVLQRIVWIKPRCIAGLPQDIDGYALANPSFPQQSTADQFFDEFQWEAYRGLGYCLMKNLLTTPKDCDLFRDLAAVRPGPLPKRFPARPARKASQGTKKD